MQKLSILMLTSIITMFCLSGCSNQPKNDSSANAKPDGSNAGSGVLSEMLSVGAPGRISDQLVDVFIAEDGSALIRIQREGAIPDFVTSSEANIVVGDQVTTTVVAGDGTGFIGKLLQMPALPATLSVRVTSYDAKESSTTFTVTDLAKRIPLQAATVEQSATLYASAINGAFARLSNSIADGSVEIAKDAFLRIAFAAKKFPASGADSVVSEAVARAAKAAQTMREKVEKSGTVDGIAGEMETERDAFGAVITRLKQPN